MTETKIRTDTTDALTTRVHHHSWRAYRSTILAGRSAPTLCGTVKSPTPGAAWLPCCPMCSDVRATEGKQCNAERWR